MVIFHEAFSLQTTEEKGTKAHFLQISYVIIKLESWCKSAFITTHTVHWPLNHTGKIAKAEPKFAAETQQLHLISV